MTIKPTRIRYKDLNARQKESYNFQKVSAVLADFGFFTLRLTDDWQGADFISQHIDGTTFRKVQLKSRLTFDSKYIGKNLYVAFPNRGSWYLYPHDVLLKVVLRTAKAGLSRTLKSNRPFHYSHLSESMTKLLNRYRISGPDVGIRNEAT